MGRRACIGQAGAVSVADPCAGSIFGNPMAIGGNHSKQPRRCREWAAPVTLTGPGHAAIRQTESGCLALADISGYTSYLVGAELDHAQDVLEDLTNTVVRALSP